MKILSYDRRKMKKILCGDLEDSTFTREVNASHFMKVVGGYGISEDAFVELVSYGCKDIVIRVTPTGDTWKSKIQDWLDHGHVADYGSGKQRFLSLTYMHLKGVSN